jgi:hypothetical protein
MGKLPYIRLRSRSYMLASLSAAAVVALNLLGAPVTLASNPVYTGPVNIPQFLSGLKAINYYPSANAWDYMWTNWNSRQFNRDMATLAAMHANSIRIIVRTNTFGYPTPSQTMLNELSTAISDAYNNGLTVDLSLFDGWSNYTDISGSETWASDVLSSYKNDARIAYIDLHSELSTTNSSADTWADTMLPYVRNITGYIPLTVSASSTANLSAQVADNFPVDFYELHFYGKAGLAYSTFSQAQSIVNDKPLYIGETGYSTYPQNTFYPDVDQNQTSQEAQQELYLRTVYYAAKSLGLPTPRWWIYSDFTQTAVPPSVFTYSADPTQYYYGLYRTDGSAKPAQSTLSSILNGGSISTAFNNGFETGDGNGLPTDWDLWQNSSNGYTATFAQDCTTAHTGSCSAEISNATSSSSGSPGYYLEPVQYIVPGHSYTATAYAKGTHSIGTVLVTLAWFDSKFNYISNTSSSSLPTGTTNWTKLTETANAPSNAAYVEIHLSTTTNTGSVWFDDVTFTAN